ncbi:MAG TPA: T9SS type A sorting domain-containing protein [Flavisolibacter sp.]|nr:T9SS type A sorting domain-containing protein [Flavisolibacter sp.]
MRKLFFILTIFLLSVCTASSQTVSINYSGSIVNWRVPEGVYQLNITARGASGGGLLTNGSYIEGGRGAQMQGIFLVQPNDLILILVGDQGTDHGSRPGGGGGTFVAKADANGAYTMANGTRVTPLLVAGGGGGAYSPETIPTVIHYGDDGPSGGSTGAGATALNGGVNGAGGQGYNAGGGGGFRTNGTQVTGTNNFAGRSFLNGGAFGRGASGGNGGFGGGGGGGTGGPGGGGGWSGGASGRFQRGGGGGSYNASAIYQRNIENINGGPGGVLISYSVAVLPLKLTSFSAHQQQAGILLRWNTAKEINTSHFEIQRSTDGHNFFAIGQVAAAGNSQTSSTYTFTDSKPLAKVNHYRLKMVDSDGGFSYSKIAVIRAEATASINLQVFPNPATSSIQVQASIKGLLHIMIYDAKGSQVKYLSVKSEGIATSFPIDVSHLNKGIYYVKVQGEDKLQTTSFIKK